MYLFWYVNEPGSMNLPSGWLHLSICEILKGFRRPGPGWKVATGLGRWGKTKIHLCYVCSLKSMLQERQPFSGHFRGPGRSKTQFVSKCEIPWPQDSVVVCSLWWQYWLKEFGSVTHTLVPVCFKLQFQETAVSLANQIARARAVLQQDTAHPCLEVRERPLFLGRAGRKRETGEQCPKASPDRTKQPSSSTAWWTVGSACRCCPHLCRCGFKIMSFSHLKASGLPPCCQTASISMSVASFGCPQIQLHNGLLLTQDKF